MVQPFIGSCYGTMNISPVSNPLPSAYADGVFRGVSSYAAGASPPLSP